MTTVTPYLTIAGATEALDWYTRAFGAEELYRLPMPDGRLGHAEMKIGETKLMVSDEWPEGNILGPSSRGGPTAAFTIIVDSVDALDAMWQRALAAGATVEREPADQFYGHRLGSLYDPFGHRWAISTMLEEVSPDELQRRMEAWSEESAGEA